MSDHRARRHSRHMRATFAIGICAAIVIAVATQATASPSAHSATAALTYVRAQIAKYKVVPTFVPPGPAFDAAKAKGKTIFTIPSSSADTFNAEFDAAMASIAPKLGIHYIEYPNQGQPSQWAQGIEEAISRKVNLITLTGAPNPAVLQPQLRAARAAGIPVLLAYYNAEGTPLPANVTAQVTVPSHQQLQLTADWTIAHTGGHVNALVITSNEVAPARGIVGALVNEFHARCGSSCSTTVVNVPLASWATGIQTAVQSALVKSPKINFVIPIFDSMCQFAVPGVVAAGAKSRVQIATSDATPFVLKDIQEKNVVAMDIGKSPNWIGYADMDQALRILAGVAPLPSEKLPYRIWDSTDIAQAGEPPTPIAGYGRTYIHGYERLWGVK